VSVASSLTKGTCVPGVRKLLQFFFFTFRLRQLVVFSCKDLGCVLLLPSLADKDTNWSEFVAADYFVFIFV